MPDEQPGTRPRDAAGRTAEGGPDSAPPQTESDAQKSAILKIYKAIEELLTLEVTTEILAVNAVSAPAETAGAQPPAAPEVQARVVTRIDLLGGDIVSRLPRDYLDEGNAALRAFHTAKEAQAQQIIDSNQQKLVALIHALRGPAGARDGGQDADG